MTKKEALKFVIVRSIGNFLVLFSLYGFFATFGPALAAEAQFRIAQVRGIEYKVARVPQVPQVAQETKEKARDTRGTLDTRGTSGFAQVLAGDKEQILIPKDTQFSIVIPKIGASAKVYPNVDPENPAEFLPILQKGIAHAKGSVFPGMQGNVYLFAHSTDNWWDVGRYNAVFYLLQHLTEGDEISVFFEGRRYEYTVTENVIKDPDDTSFLTQAQGGEEQLILQTCWPPGTTWKRLYITAVPKTVQ